MKKILPFVLCLLLLFPGREARADFWGADLAFLAELVANSLSQLAQLRALLSNGKDSFELLSDINRGINDSLSLAQTLGLRIDPGIYRDLRDVDQAARALGDLFGRPPNSPLAPVQRNTDQTVAEAITFNNELNDYTQKLDRIGEDIKQFSHAVSPGGAAKLTAESMGVMIHVMNQQIRATGQGLKLQAQSMAIANKEQKDKTEEYLHESTILQQKMQSLDSNFTVPRF